MAEFCVTSRNRSGKRGTGEILCRIWRYMGKNQGLILLAGALSILSSVMALVNPRLSGQAINAISLGTAKVDFDVVYRCAARMVPCYFCSAALSYLLNVVMVKLSSSIAKQMRKDIFSSLSAMSVYYFDDHATGDLVSVLSYDISTVNQSLSSDFLQILQTGVTIIGSFAMMIVIAPGIALIFAVTIPLTMAMLRWILSKSRPLFRLRSIRLGELNGFVEEMLSGQKTVRAYGREKEVIRKFDEKNKVAAEAYTTAEAKGTIAPPSVGLINNLSLTLICVVGSLLFLKGRMRLGDLSSFVQYSRSFSGPINELSNTFADLQSAFSAAERVFDLIDGEREPQDAHNAVTLENVQGDIRMEHVNFSYVTGCPVIRDLSLHAKPGSLIAIVGPTGAGKTTIINLLMRFYETEQGLITIDGHDIRLLTRSSLRGAFAMVLQDTWLFHGTVFENISYGKEDATQDEVIRAAKAVGIHSCIENLPHGYDTVLTDNGESLSKGQKQMLTIARAMLQNAGILILDEATSNVDTQTEQQIQQAMQKLMRGRTSFVIAHRLSTIQSADWILVMKDGQVCEQGNHCQLMEADGLYSQIYRSQFDPVD